MLRKWPQIRFSLAVIALFTFVASKGCDLVRQALLSSGDSAALPAWVEAPSAAADIAGARLYARTDLAAPFFDGPLDMTDLQPADRAVRDVLQVWPLAAAYWVRLAEIRAASGSDIQAVIGAYQLSVLAAPYDGEMMLARQVLGVQLWDVLPADDRRNVLSDLASVWDQRPPAVTEQLREATASLSAEGREALKAQMKARTQLLDRQLALIGL
jgi:hypothetical protein